MGNSSGVVWLGFESENRVGQVYSWMQSAYASFGGDPRLAREQPRGKSFDESIPDSAFFFRVEISSRTPNPLHMPGPVHSGSANSDYCGRAFPDELRVSSFPWSVSTLCLDSMVSPLWLRCVNGVCVFRCNLPPALLAEWPRSFMCHCGNTGVSIGPCGHGGGTDTGVST